MNPRELQHEIEEAREAITQGDLRRAWEIIDALVEVAADEPDVVLVRAELLVQGDAAEEALKAARRATEVKADVPLAWQLLAIAAWRRSRLTLAQSAFTRAVEVSDNDAATLADLAWFMAFERGPRPAEKAAQRAVAANAKSPTAWAALGLAQFRLHRVDEAEESLKRALKLDPTHAEAQWAMMELLHERRDDAKALALADLLEDVPGTESLVEPIRSEAAQRKMTGRLLERNALPQANRDDHRRRAIWIAGLAVMIGMLVALFQPTRPLEIAVCVLMPLAIVWAIRAASR